MANKWEHMNRLRTLYPKAHVKLLDDPKEMKKGMRAVEIGVASGAEFAALDQLEAEIQALGDES